MSPSSWKPETIPNKITPMMVVEKPSWIQSFLPGCCTSDYNSPTPSPAALPSKAKKKSSSSSSKANNTVNPRRPSSPYMSQSRLGRFPDLNDPNSLTLSEDLSNSLAGSNIHSFTVQELKLITQNFSSGNFLGEGGFGPVHKGFVDDKVRPGLKAQPVAVKLLDLDGSQGHREWLAEVIFLGQLRHPHLVKLIGYCCEDEHRLLVYEYMPRGSLENQLFRRFSASLPWLARMKIALGAAKGLAFLHEAEKPVIYRDFKASNILLDSDFTPKLSDFGLAKDGPEGDDSHVSTRILGTQGYAAPEYIMTGHLTKASDVYSFGVVLVELLTGRRSMDKNRPQREQNLADWARPQLNSPKRLARIMDPRLEGMYSESGVKLAAELAYQCLSLKAKNRPEMCKVVEWLEPLLVASDIPSGHFVYEAPVVEGGRERKRDGKGKDKINEIRQHNRSGSGGGVVEKRRGGGGGESGDNNRSGSGEKRRDGGDQSREKRRSGETIKSSRVCSDPRVQRNLKNGLNSPMYLNERGA